LEEPHKQVLTEDGSHGTTGWPRHFLHQQREHRFTQVNREIYLQYSALEILRHGCNTLIHLQHILDVCKCLPCVPVILLQRMRVKVNEADSFSSRNNQHWVMKK